MLWHKDSQRCGPRPTRTMTDDDTFVSDTHQPKARRSLSAMIHGERTLTRWQDVELHGGVGGVDCVVREVGELGGVVSCEVVGGGDLWIWFILLLPNNVIVIKILSSLGKT